MPADPILIPGSIPGLLRRGSPVVILSTDGQTTDCAGRRLDVGDVATLTDEPTDRYCVASGLTVDDLGPGWSELPLSGVALDLTSATGRAHAAWWLAERHEAPPTDPVSVTWERFPGQPDTGWWHRWKQRLAGPGSVTVLVSYTTPEAVSAGMDARRVPSLSGLDPDDPRRLPDGSRYVDAEALRRLALHVAGRTA